MHIFICSLQKHIISICSTVGIIVAIYASGNDFAFCFLGAQVIDTLPFNTHNDVKGQSVAWNFINLMGMSFDDPSGDSKKNDTPSRRSSKECRDSSPRRDDPKGSKPSVEKKLEENKRKLERESKKQKDRTRDKSRSKQKSKPKTKER